MTSVAKSASKSVLPEEEQMSAGAHTLPASWWFSKEIFQLEKRAVFCKSWLYTAHAMTFVNIGDYITYNFMGIQFFLVKTQSGEIKAYHNICRHKAHPVLRKQKGSTIVLDCPCAESADFEQSKDSLYPIHTYVTDQGLIFINFDNSDEITPFGEFFQGLEEEWHEFDFSNYDYHMSYELDGKFNWKTLMDGYMECYHCPTAHPGLTQAFQMTTYKVEPRSKHARHYCDIKRNEDVPKAAQKKKQESTGWFGLGKKAEAEAEKPKNVGGDFDGLWMYLCPTNGINCYSPAWYSIRVLPVTPNHTILQYDIFTQKGLPEEDKDEFVEFLQQVEIEDYDLCVKTQKNLDQGIYSTGYLHPQKESGVVFYQSLVKDMCKEHYAKERAAGHLIDPSEIGEAETDAFKEIGGKIQSKGPNPETFAYELDW